MHYGARNMTLVEHPLRGVIGFEMRSTFNTSCEDSYHDSSSTDSSSSDDDSELGCRSNSCNDVINRACRDDVNDDVMDERRRRARRRIGKCRFDTTCGFLFTQFQSLRRQREEIRRRLAAGGDVGTCGGAESEPATGTVSPQSDVAGSEVAKLTSTFLLNRSDKCEGHWGGGDSGGGGGGTVDEKEDERFRSGQQHYSWRRQQSSSLWTLMSGTRRRKHCTLPPAAKDSTCSCMKTDQVNETTNCSNNNSPCLKLNGTDVTHDRGTEQNTDDVNDNSAFTETFNDDVDDDIPRTNNAQSCHCSRDIVTTNISESCVDTEPASRLERDVKIALAQALPMARMQVEVEKQIAKKTSPIAEIIGIPNFGEHPKKFKLTRDRLYRMNVTELSIVVNDLMTQIEDLNRDLVTLLLERDERYIEQDAVLTDIEDLKRSQKLLQTDSTNWVNGGNTLLTSAGES